MTGEFETRPWPPGGAAKAAALVLLFSTAGVLYYPTFASMMALWSYEGFRHCWLIPLTVLALLWQKRQILLDTRWSGSWSGLLILGLCLWLWIVSRNISLQVLEHVAVLLMVGALAWSLVGNRIFRSIAFPFAFLILAVPFGDGTVPWLMEITADISMGLLQLFGVPVYREGAFMTLPGGSFEVAESCSGFRYLNAGIAISLLAAYLSLSSWLIGAIYVTTFALVCVLLNGVRAFLVMWIASATEMQYMTGYDHVVFGWILFALGMFIMIWAAERFSGRGRAQPS